MERYNSLINEAVYLLHIENQTFEELVETFDNIVDNVFEDGIYDWGRFLALETFATILANRAIHVNRDLLYSAFNQRINSERNAVLHW